MQRRVSADGHVSAAEIIVYWSHKSDDVQIVVLLRHLVRDPSWKPTDVVSSLKFTIQHQWWHGNKTDQISWVKKKKKGKVNSSQTAADLSVRAHPAGRSTHCGRRWLRWGCRLHRTHTGWWCLSSPGWRRRRCGPRASGRPCSERSRSPCHPAAETLVKTKLKHMICSWNDKLGHTFFPHLFFSPADYDS